MQDNENMEKEEVVDLSGDDELDFDGLDDFEIEKEDVKSLKEKYEKLYGDDATSFGDMLENKNEENAIVFNASYEKIKNKLKRRYNVYIKVDHKIRKGEIEEEYHVEKFGKKQYDKNGDPIIEIRKRIGDIEVPVLAKYEMRKPTDKERFDIQRFGAENLDDMANLNDEDYEKANEEIAKYLSNMITKPSLTAEQWRNDVEQAIYQSLFFKIVAASVQTDEAALIDFLAMY